MFVAYKTENVEWSGLERDFVCKQQRVSTHGPHSVLVEGHKALSHRVSPLPHTPGFHHMGLVHKDLHL